MPERRNENSAAPEDCSGKYSAVNYPLVALNLLRLSDLIVL